MTGRGSYEWQARTPDGQPGRVRGADDLGSQFEELLHAVWSAEADWRLDDRIDLAVRLQARTPGRRRAARG